MLKQEKTTIRGSGYQVTQLPYSLGHKLMLRLYKALGPAAARALATVDLPEGDLLGVHVRDLLPALAAAVQGLAESLSEEDFDFTVATLAEYTQISLEAGKWVPLKDHMEFHFAGNYVELFQWLGFALRVNFGGFTGEQGTLAALLEKAKAVQRARQSPTSSTGTSTESPAPTGTPAP